MNPNPLGSLPFDQYQRYRLVADILEQLTSGPDARGVLDVGGRTGLMRRFLPAGRVSLVDLEPSEESGLVLGDGAALPFRTGSFDVVCSCDTLEHVPPDKRAAFVAECARVARRHVILAGPFREPRVDEAEELLLEVLRGGLGIEHRYLREHRANGLPVRAQVEEELRSMGARVRSIGQGRLDRWLLSMCLGMYMDGEPTLQGLAHEFHRFYNRELFPSDHGRDVYRHVVLAAFGDAPLPEPLPAQESPEELAGVRRILEFAAQMGLLERARRAWAVERDAWVADRDEWLEDKRQVLATLDELRADVEGHAATIRTLKADLVENRKERADLSADLAEHRMTLAEAQRHHEEVIADKDSSIRQHLESLEEVEADLEQHQEENRTLREDLAGHVEALTESERHHEEVLAARDAELGEYRRTIEALQGDLEEHRVVKAALEERLERLEGLARDLQAQIGGVERRAQELGETLVSRSELVAALVRELRSRPRNLLRAFSPKKYEATSN